MSIDINNIGFEEEHIERKFRARRLQNILNVVKNMEYQRHFEVGQILVRRSIKDRYAQKAGEFEKNDHGIIQKYIVANKLHSGLILCRALNASGRPGKGIHIIADEDYDYWRYEEDPDIADSILLDYDYDPLKLPKMMGRAKSRQQRYNRDIKVCNVVKTQRGKGNSETVAQYLLDILLTSTDEIKMWKLDDDKNKIEVYKLVTVDGEGWNTKATVQNINGGKPWEVDIYTIASDNHWSGTWYFDEPMRLDDALEYIKMKDR